jgi:hypothetical protein
VHRQQHARDGQARVELALEERQACPAGRRGPRGRCTRLHRDDHALRGDRPLTWRPRRRAVEQDERAYRRGGCEPREPPLRRRQGGSSMVAPRSGRGDEHGEALDAVAGRACGAAPRRERVVEARARRARRRARRWRCPAGRRRRPASRSPPRRCRRRR